MTRLAYHSDGLVCGGSITLSNGQVWGGDVFYGTVISGVTPNTVESTCQVLTPATQALNFGDSNSYIDSLSSGFVWSSYYLCSCCSIWWGIEISTAHNGLVVVNVNAADISNSHTITLVHIPNTFPQGVIINVIGNGPLNFQNMGFNGFQNNGVDFRKKTIWNYAGTTVNAAGIGLQGTLLAPNADISANNGNFEGHVFAKSFNGNLETHWYPYNGCLPSGLRA